MTAGGVPGSSLIIASRNRPALLIDCIASILRGKILPDEIIVVDQSDAPNSALDDLRAERTTLRYIHSSTRGLSRANNIGIGESRYSTIVFTHDDVLVDPDWFGAILGAVEQGGRDAVVTGRVDAGEAELPNAVVLTLTTTNEPATYFGRVGGDVLYPLNMALRREIFDRVGLFDEALGPGTRFPAAEDNDLGYRILEAGLRIVYAPQAVVRHRAWRADRVGLRWAYGRGQGAYYAKHLRRNDRYMLRRFARDFWRHATRAPGNVLRHGWSIGVGDGVHAVALFAGAFGWWWTSRTDR